MSLLCCLKNNDRETIVKLRELFSASFWSHLLEQEPVLKADPHNITMMMTPIASQYSHRDAFGKDVYESCYYYAEKNPQSGLWTYGESYCMTNSERVNTMLADRLGLDATFRYLAHGEEVLRNTYNEMTPRNISCDWKLVKEALERQPPARSAASPPHYTA
jgi:hypothetical protein